MLRSALRATTPRAAPRALTARLISYQTYKAEIGPFLQSRASVWLPAAAVTDAAKLQSALTAALTAIAEESREGELSSLLTDDGAIAAACDNVKQRALADEDVGLDAGYFSGTRDNAGATTGAHGGGVDPGDQRV
jgi:hypothetical protein